MIEVAPGADVEALAARHGAAVERSLAEIGVCVLSAPAAAVEGLRADPAVARLGDDFGMPHWTFDTEADQPTPWRYPASG